MSSSSTVNPYPRERYCTACSGGRVCVHIHTCSLNHIKHPSVLIRAGFRSWEEEGEDTQSHLHQLSLSLADMLEEVKDRWCDTEARFSLDSLSSMLKAKI